MPNTKQKSICKHKQIRDISFQLRGGRDWWKDLIDFSIANNRDEDLVEKVQSCLDEQNTKSRIYHVQKVRVTMASK